MEKAIGKNSENEQSIVGNNKAKQSDKNNKNKIVKTKKEKKQEKEPKAPSWLLASWLHRLHGFMAHGSMPPWPHGYHSSDVSLRLGASQCPFSTAPMGAPIICRMQRLPYPGQWKKQSSHRQTCLHQREVSKIADGMNAYSIDQDRATLPSGRRSGPPGAVEHGQREALNLSPPAGATNAIRP